MKRFRRLGLLLGPMMVALMLASMLAGLSPVEAAKKSTTSKGYKAAAVCPTDASAITSMSVRITRNGVNTTVSNLSTVQPGDKVRVSFDLDNDCSNYRVSLVAYKAPDISNNLDTLSSRVVASSASNVFGSTGGSLTVTVPTCYFALVFATGSAISTMSASNTYGAREVDTANGGTYACSGITGGQPIFFSGNPGCSTLGATYSEDWDEYTVSGAPGNGTTYTIANGYTFRTTNSASGKFDWTSTGTSLKAVFVRSSSGGNLYRYTSGSWGASNLKAAGLPNGSLANISMVRFCFAPIPTQSICPDGMDAVTAYYFEIWRNGSKVGTYNDLNNVQQGDIVKAYFTLAAGCTNFRVSFAGYESPDSYYDINTVDEQVYIPYTGDTGQFSSTQSASTRMVQTKVPNCNYQVDLVVGPVIANLTSTNLYGDAKLAWRNAGNNLCTWAITPTNTPTNTKTNTPNATSTAKTVKTETAAASTATEGAKLTATSAQKTNTSVAKTQTANAPTNTPTKSNTPVPPTSTFTATSTPTETNTPVPPTETDTPTMTSTAPAITDTPTETNTPVPPTVTDTGVPPTNTATNTPKPPTATFTATATPVPGRLRIHKKERGTDDHLEGACFKVRKGAWNETVCDNSAQDVDDTPGIVQVNDLVPATYMIQEVVAPEHYDIDSNEYPIYVQSGSIGSVAMTIRNALLPGSLIIHKTDDLDAALAGACFTVIGEDASETICDNGSGDSNATGGQIAITGLTPGEYTVQEHSAPAGYDIDPTVYNVHIYPGDMAASEMTIVNAASVGSLQIHKINDDANPLGGACFTVTGPGFNDSVCDGVAPDADAAEGEIRLDSLLPGIYTVIEQSAPSGYALNMNVYTVTVVAGTSAVEVTILNSLFGELRIHKVDQDNLLLTGACFSVSGPNDYYVFICDDDSGDGTDATDSSPISGETWIENVTPGTYIVAEAINPSGYIGDYTDKTVVVPAGGYGEVTIVNYLETTGGPGTDVTIWKLNCDSNPGPINTANVIAGILPEGCVMAPAGVTFDVSGPEMTTITDVQTTAAGKLTVHIGYATNTITVTEHAGSNNGYMTAGPVTYNGIQCECNHSDVVMVNLKQP